MILLCDGPQDRVGLNELDLRSEELIGIVWGYESGRVFTHNFRGRLTIDIHSCG